MAPVAIVAGIAAGVAELVKMGMLAAEQSEQAVEVLVKAMKPTPSSDEVDDYREAQAELLDTPSDASER